MKRSPIPLTATLSLKNFRVGRLDISFLPTWYCFLSIRIASSSITLSTTQGDQYQQEESQTSDEAIKQSSRSSAFRWISQRVLRRVIIWLIRHIDVQFEDIQIIILDSDVLFQFYCYYA